MQQHLVDRSKLSPPREKGRERKKEDSQKQFLNRMQKFEEQFEILKEIAKEYPKNDVKKQLNHVFQALNKSKNILKHNLSQMYQISL